MYSTIHTHIYTHIHIWSIIIFVTILKIRDDAPTPLAGEKGQIINNLGLREYDMMTLIFCLKFQICSAAHKPLLEKVIFCIKK